MFYFFLFGVIFIHCEYGIGLKVDVPSEDGEIGPFVSNEIRWLKYKLCPLKSCFCAICF